LRPNSRRQHEHGERERDEWRCSHSYLPVMVGLVQHSVLVILILA
jgi:hypothetical protein